MSRTRDRRFERPDELLFRTPGVVALLLSDVNRIELLCKLGLPSDRPSGSRYQPSAMWAPGTIQQETWGRRCLETLHRMNMAIHLLLMAFAWWKSVKFMSMLICEEEVSCMSSFWLIPKQVSVAVPFQTRIFEDESPSGYWLLFNSYIRFIQSLQTNTSIAVQITLRPPPSKSLSTHHCLSPFWCTSLLYVSYI